MPALTLQSSAGRLVARHDPPEAPPPPAGPLAAVVCHPHPLHGSTLDNKVVHTVARALRERGLHVVRFNFRGAGGSEGEFDGGRGEQDDVAAALDHAASLVPPGAGLLAAGFSFGSWVGLEVGRRDERVTALLALAPPVDSYDFSAIARTTKPLAVIYALADELIPARRVEAFVATCCGNHRVTAIEGAGHLFHGKLAGIRRAVDRFCDELSRPGPR